MNIIIVAYSSNRVIGDKGKIPWKLKADMEHFKETTTGHSVVMGRKTWESIPERFKPLAERLNVVVTRIVDNNVYIPAYSDDGATCTYCSPSIESALDLANSYSGTNYICGGETIYRYVLEKNLVDKIIATEIKKYYKGDTYFPSLATGWKPRILREAEDFNIIEYTKARG